MDKWKMRATFLTGLLACFSFLLSFAQPLVKTSVDKNEILIGEQFNLKIEASLLPDGYKIKWPVVPDSLAHFEVVKRSKLDSAYNDRQLTGLAQTLTVTSFDSGKWTFPSFLVGMVPAKDDTTYNFFTDSVPVTVLFSTSDTTSQLRDIKPIREVEVTNHFWYWIAAGALLAVLTGLLVWWYKRQKKKKGVSAPVKTSLSPYDEAMMELEKLKTFNLTIPADIKIVHSRLAEILKRYLYRRQNINYANKTTGDILILLSDQFRNNDLLTKLAGSLRCSDAVKFAKYLPPSDESEASIQSIKEAIEDIQQQANRNHSTANTKI